MEPTVGSVVYPVWHRCLSCWAKIFTGAETLEENRREYYYNRRERVLSYTRPRTEKLHRIATNTASTQSNTIEEHPLRLFVVNIIPDFIIYRGLFDSDFQTYSLESQETLPGKGI